MLASARQRFAARAAFRASMRQIPHRSGAEIWSHKRRSAGSQFGCQESFEAVATRRRRIRRIPTLLPPSASQEPSRTLNSACFTTTGPSILSIGRCLNPLALTAQLPSQTRHCWKHNGSATPARRWVSSNPSFSNRDKSNGNKTADEEAPKASVSSFSAEEVRSRVNRIVGNRNLDDILTVSAIVVVFGVMAVWPFASREMRKSSRQFDDIGTTDDPVDDFPQLAREEWLELGKANQNVLEDVLKDVVRSKALQQAAQQFVVQILQSDEVRKTLNRLVKQLWMDLVTDEETVSQVINLLQIAIRDEQVKQAAQQLVIELVEDPEVKKVLIEMVQNLGKSKEVQQATQALLVNSAHRSLNDTEILEHSMEFATDVLGDDVVQQTAGEALRNTVGHAFRPAAVIAVTSTGISLILFGIVAIGYARSNDKEVHLFEAAAKSLQANAAYGLVRLITWPFRKLYSGVESLGRVLIVRPMRGLQHAVRTLVGLPGVASRAMVAWFVERIAALAQELRSLWQSTGNRAAQGWDATAAAILGATHTVMAGLVSHVWRVMSGAKSTLDRSEQHILNFLLAVEEAILAWWDLLFFKDASNC